MGFSFVCSIFRLHRSSYRIVASPLASAMWRRVPSCCNTNRFCWSEDTPNVTITLINSRRAPFNVSPGVLPLKLEAVMLRELSGIREQAAKTCFAELHPTNSAFNYGSQWIEGFQHQYLSDDRLCWSAGHQWQASAQWIWKSRFTAFRQAL